MATSPVLIVCWLGLVLLSIGSVQLGNAGGGLLLAAAILLAALPEVLRHTVGPLQMTLLGEVWIEAEVLRQLLYGLALVLIMLVRPAGLWPSPRPEDRPLPMSSEGRA